MPYARNVVVDSLPFPALSIAIDETRAVFRILADRSCIDNADELVKGDVEDLMTTQNLYGAFAYWPRKYYYEIDGGEYAILAEGVLDKTSHQFSPSWQPAAHYVFHYDPCLGAMRVDAKGGLTYFSKRTTADEVRYQGGSWLFDIWVRNPDAPLTECARSITTAPGVKIVTNLESLGEIWRAEHVMQGGKSGWLNLAFRLTPDAKTVAPDAWMNYTVEVLDGKTLDVAEDVTCDCFIVDAVDGYAPHKRVNIVNGIGTFRVKALGLEHGEKMRVKLDQRFYTSRAESVIDVVDPALDGAEE